MICHCILSLQTQCKRFHQDCNEVCSSLQQHAVTATSPCGDCSCCRHHFGCCRFFVLFRYVSCIEHKFGRTVLVYLEATCTCKRTKEISKQVEKNKSNNAAKAAMHQNRWVFLSEKERYSNPFARGPLTLCLISAMDTRGHYGRLHPWTPHREGNKVI
jgi:hypothetical protein